MARKFYRNVVSFVVLTEDAPIPDGMSLRRIEAEADSGDWVGGNVEITHVELTGKDAADALYSLGSEPGFFRLDEDGVEEDE
jgi:hypothetical protein